MSNGVEVRCDDEAITNMITWAARHYDLYNITITVKKAPKGSDCSARVHPSRRTKKRNYYVIELNWDAIAEYQHNVHCTVFHEMTHVKQFEKDGLRYLGGTRNRFQGQIWHFDENNIYEYFDAPWEQEARLAESPMYWLYRKHELGIDL